MNSQYKNKKLNFLQKSLYSLFLASFVIFSFAIPVLTFAQYEVDPKDPPKIDTKLKNPIGTDNLNDFIKHVLEGAIKIGIPVVAIAIIYSGFLYVTAMGNEEKLKTAHNAILYTLIGAALLIGSWAIAQLISDTVLKL